MSAVFARAPLRPEYENLLKNEELSRQARRLMTPADEVTDVARFAALTLIDDAVAQLVAARAAIDPAAAARAASPANPNAEECIR